MDTLDDKELESIWKRVKKYIPVNRIKGRNPQEVLTEIERYMREAGQEGGESGSMTTLVKNGFASEDAFGRTKEFQSNLDNWVSGAPEEIEAPREVEIPKVRTLQKGKLSILTSKGKRSYASKNIRISYGTFKNRKSFYVYNVRLKRRITWGVLND